MNELLAVMFGFYIAFNWHRLWGWFCGLKNQERVLFGIIVFNCSVLYYWFSI